MADLIRVQLTGVFRDQAQVVPLSGEQDPGCEVQFKDISAGTSATNQTAKVYFANGAPCPWYAAMAYFYGTLQCTTSFMVIGLESLRVYTVTGPSAAVLVTALARRVPGDPQAGGQVCIELPAEARFHALVVGRTQPARTGEYELPEPPGALGSGSWSSMPVLPDSWGRFIFLAPDGSSYGSDMDSSRWVRGYYPAPLVSPSAPVGQDTITKARVASGQQPLQAGTNVVLVARFPDTTAPAVPSYDQAYSWQVCPGEAPPATIQLVRSGTDQWGQAWNEYNTGQVYDTFFIMAYDETNLQWDLASVIPSTPTGTDNTARNDRSILGVLLGSNGQGAPTCPTLTICTAGRFWVNQDVYAFAENTDYYIASTAEAGGADQGLPGATPCDRNCRRPVFHHFVGGWCEMYPQGLGPGQRFRYDNVSGQEAIIDCYATADPDPSVIGSRVVYRDFDFTAAADPGSIGVEADEVMAWFVNPAHSSTRCLAIKRLDLVLSRAAVEGDDIINAVPETRGGRFVIGYDQTDGRVEDGYIGPPSVDDPAGATVQSPWMVVQGDFARFDSGSHPSEVGPSDGSVAFIDNQKRMLNLNCCKVGPGTTVLPRRYITTETSWLHTGGWDWRWYDSTDERRISITEIDVDALDAGFFTLPQPCLRIRQIEVCGPGGPTDIKHIAILASDEY